MIPFFCGFILILMSLLNFIWHGYNPIELISLITGIGFMSIKEGEKE